jgi:hypothetical protein
MKSSSIVALIQAFATTAAGAALPETLEVGANSLAPAELNTRANCAIHTKFHSTWKVAAYARYRVEAWAEGYSSSVNWHPHKMLDEWCRAFYGASFSPHLNLPEKSHG